jgi:TPR repeat protein
MNLGVMHERGDGIRPDVVRAKELYSKACQLQEGGGCRQLGQLYARGFGGQPPNAKLALLFAERACALSDAIGCGNAGMNYQLGHGTDRDSQRAARMYKRACDLGGQQFCELLDSFK